MEATALARHFSRIGARLRVEPTTRRMERPFALDIGHDRAGEYFSIRAQDPAGVEMSTIEVRPDMRHLLLLARGPEGKEKFLCGHDERHWFVAAVPNRGAVTGVVTAMEALKPFMARVEQNRRYVPYADRVRRKTAAYIRQGEWFFIPLPWWQRIDPKWALHNEPLRRGNGKPHIAEECVREGGEIVYVSRRYPNVLTETQHKDLLVRRPKMRALKWTQQRRNPAVYVRGSVRHADHATIYLPTWHLVQMNTETEAPAMRSVAFLD